MGITEGHTHKYAVRIAGSNCHATVGSGSLTTGFFATRFVEARDEDQAARHAMELVRQDLTRYEVVRPGHCALSVDEIWEDPVAFDRYAPGAGFSWY